MGNIISFGYNTKKNNSSNIISSKSQTDLLTDPSINPSMNPSMNPHQSQKNKSLLEFITDDNYYYGVYTGGNKTISEDVCESFTLKTKSYLMHVQLVLDGHGDYGEFFASTCKTLIASEIINYVNECEKTQQRLSITGFESFLKSLIDLKCNEIIKKSLPRNNNKSDNKSDNKSGDDVNIRNVKTNEIIHGGTTCTICVILTYPDMRRFVINVNVGDSPSLIIFNSGESYALTTMHSASNPAEQFRIRRSDLKMPFKFVYGSGSDNVLQPCNSTPDSDIINDPFPSEYSIPDITAWYQRHPGVQPSNIRMEPSIYALYQYPSSNPIPDLEETNSLGIAMTRSIGDFNGLPHGLIHKSDSRIIEFPSTDTRQFIICSFSDGIGDLIFYDKFAKEVLTYVNTMGVNETGSFLINKYKKFGHQTFGDGYDDACLCIYNSFINP